jgi:uncharacterized protein (DUF1697 family)
MTSFVALLRAVNVGGTGKLPMRDLKAIGEAAGLGRVRTYIASGNLVFESALAEAGVKAALEAGLADYAGKPVGVLVRTAEQMKAVLTANPFPEAPPSRTLAFFLDEPPPPDALRGVTGRLDEEIGLGTREIYVCYPSGIGPSKLAIRAAGTGTARNMNTVAALARMALPLGNN